MTERLSRNGSARRAAAASLAVAAPLLLLAALLAGGRAAAAAAEGGAAGAETPGVLAPTLSEIAQARQTPGVLTPPHAVSPPWSRSPSLPVLLAAPAALTETALITGGLRPLALPVQLVESLDPSNPLSSSFTIHNAISGTLEWLDGAPWDIHRGWLNYGYVWHPGEDPTWPRAVDPNCSTTDLKDWMQNGWDLPLWAGDYVDGDSSINSSALCSAPTYTPFYVPVIDAILVCSTDVPDPKPACPGDDGYVYRVAGVAPVEFTGCSAGAAVITATLLSPITLYKNVTPTTAAPGQAVTYTITFSNRMAPLAAGVVLTDLLPAEIVASGVVSAGALITDTGLRPGYAWRVADLPLGTGGAITITGVVSPGLVTDTVLVNTAQTLAATDGTEVPNTSEAALTVTVPVLVLGGGALTVTEGVGTVPLTVSLSLGSPLTITVGLTATGGAALAGQDYTAAGALTFTPGVTLQVVSVGVVSDTVKERDETVVLSLVDPSCAALGAPSSVALTILGELVHDVTLPLVLR